MERLVEIAKISKPSVNATSCQVCIENGAKDPETATATQYCIQCQQHICKNCTQDHRKFKGLRDHQIVSLDSQFKEDLIRKCAVEYCNQHSKKETEMYCFNCKTLICMMCFAEEHRSHKCLGLEKAVEGFRGEIAIDLNQMEFFSKEASDKICEIENHRKKFQGELENTEKLILKRGKQLKERVDERLSLLLNELNSVRFKGEKQLEIEKEVERHRISVESLVLYYKELITKGSSTEISRGMDELSCRIKDIKDNHSRHIQHQIQLNEIVFASSKVEQFLEGDTIVGSIEDEGLKFRGATSVDNTENAEYSTSRICAKNAEFLLNDKEYIDKMQPQIIDTMRRLNNIRDFSSKKCLDDVKFLYSTYDLQRKSRSRKVGDILATSGITELFQRILEKHFKKEITSYGETPVKNLMTLIVNVLLNFTDKSKLLCVRVFKGNLMNDIVSYLDSKYLDPMVTDSASLNFITGLLAILHNTFTKVAESSQVLRKKRTVHVFQRFRKNPNKDVALIALILQGHLVGEDEIELLNSTDDNFQYMKQILEDALNRDNFWVTHNGYSAIEIVSALNSLAINDGNKMRIVNAGLLPIYVKFLQEGCSVEEQATAAEGLLILSTNFLNEIENEPGCLAGLQNLTFCKSERVRLLAEEVLLNFEVSKMRL